MCISATILAAASFVTTAAGTATSVMANNAQNSAMQQQLALQREQLNAEREQQLMQTRQAELQRLKDFQRQRASGFAALATMGLGDHMSFLQGIDPAEREALRMDLSNIRLGYLTGANRIADEIRVNRLSSQVSSYNKTMGNIGAGINLIGAGINSASFVKNYQTAKSLKNTKVYVEKTDGP